MNALPLDVIRKIALYHNYVNHKLRVTCKRFYEAIPHIPKAPPPPKTTYNDIIIGGELSIDVFSGRSRRHVGRGCGCCNPYNSAKVYPCECCGIRNNNTKLLYGYVGDYIFHFLCETCRLQMYDAAVKHKIHNDREEDTDHLREVTHIHEIYVYHTLDMYGSGDCYDEHGGPHFDHEYTWWLYKIKDEMKERPEWKAYTEECRSMVLWNRSEPS